MIVYIIIIAAFQTHYNINVRIIIHSTLLTIVVRDAVKNVLADFAR